MNKMALYVSLCIFMMSTAISLKAQLKLPGTQSAFTADMEKIVRDYPNHFKNIIGNLIVENPQSADYESKIVPAGAMDCSITRYSSGKKEINSWQALMFVSDDFNLAEKKFKSFYSQLNSLNVKFNDAVVYKYRADYVKPVENKRFFNIINITVFEGIFYKRNK